MITMARYTRAGIRLPDGHATLACMCGPGRTSPTCESLRTTPACSFPGCGKPTAYLPGPNGFGWRHVAPDDEGPHHGHPLTRAVEADRG